MTALTLNALYVSIDYSGYDIPTFLRRQQPTKDIPCDPVDYEFFERYFETPTFLRKQGSVFRDPFRKPLDQIHKGRFSKANSKENVQ